MAQPDPVAHAQLAWQSVHAEFGATHAATLAALLALAAARRDAGDTTGALRDANQVLAARREQLGAEHPDTLATAALLANWRLHAGDSTAADTLHELLPVLTRVLGAEHPDTLHAHHTLAAAQDAGDDPADRLVRWVQLTGAETRVFGVRHELTLAAAYAAAFARHELGDTFGASQDALVVESYRRNLLGEHHPDTLAARLARLTWYGEATGVTDEILSRFDDLIPVLQNVLGHDHPDTVLARYTRTAWTPPTHDEVETTSEWEILADDVARVHGNQHPLTVAARDKLAAAQADWQDSLDMCRELAADLWSDFIAEDRAGDPQSVRGSEVDDDLERVRDKADAEHAALIDLMATVVAVKKSPGRQRPHRGQRRVADLAVALLPGLPALGRPPVRTRRPTHPATRRRLRARPGRRTHLDHGGAGTAVPHRRTHLETLLAVLGRQQRIGALPAQRKVIAAMLGTSRQAARERFGEPT